MPENPESRSTPPEKTVLWIDPNFSFADPTTRHLLHALPRLQKAGWRVKIWCQKSEAPRDGVEHVFLPQGRWLGPLNWLYFSLLAHGHGLWRRATGKARPADIIHATCSAYLGADIVPVHFLNCVWLRKQMSLGFSGLREIAAFCIHALGAVAERVHWRSPALKVLLPVSDSVGVELRGKTRRSVAIETLPNSYDETRFNPSVREERRVSSRENLGYRMDDVVFIFSSLGHYKRKGFWLAIAALARLRADPAMARAKFLVVGGLPATLARLQARLDREVPDWRQWITFTGQRADMENHLAAADALLFPSYFETYSLVALEAAAMGVPLLLTRFHGSEMTMSEGINGLWLDYDPDSIAATLRRFIQRGPSAFRHSIGKALTRAGYADRLLAIYERVLAESAAAQGG